MSTQTARADQRLADAQQRRVVAGTYLPADQKGSDSHMNCVGGETHSDPPAPAMSSPTPTVDAPVLADPFLALAADVLDDLERVRIANENRLRQMTRTATDTDGAERGFGLPAEHPDVARLAALVAALVKAEHDAELHLNHQLRRHPLGPWVKTQRGVGDKQAARLLAAIGDPYIRPAMQHDDHSEPSRPRTVSELWALCGYCPGQRRRRGERANWSSAAKMRAFNIAESTVKQLKAPCQVVKGERGEYIRAEHVEHCRCSTYRVVYDDGRAKYADTVHPEPCDRCGPRGHPAPAGSPRSAAHQHQMAVRLATKTFLRDLWREARRLHEEPTDA